MEDGKSMTVVLKPGFAPIEQYQTRGQGPYTDLYALCATLYYCLTGKVPPAAPERLSAVFDGQSDPLPPPTSLGAALTPEQEQLLLWGMAIQPTDRPQSVQLLAQRLEQTLVSHQAASPVGYTGQEEIPGQKGRSSLWQRYGLGLLLGAAAVIVVLLILLLLQ